jgi:hypothetical protein
MASGLLNRQQLGFKEQLAAGVRLFDLDFAGGLLSLGDVLFVVTTCATQRSWLLKVNIALVA